MPEPALASLLRLFATTPQLDSLAGLIRRGDRAHASGVVHSARVLLASELVRRLGRPAVLLVEDDGDVNPLLRDASVLAPGTHPRVFDPLLSLVGETEVRTAPSVGLLIATTTVAATPIPAPGEGKQLALRLGRGSMTTIEAVTGWLDDNAYERVDLVTEPGEYAARGGIVDVFPEETETPVRIEFDGDLVSGLRDFDPLSQRSIARVDRVLVRTRRAAVDSGHRSHELLPGGAVVVTEADITGLEPAVRLVAEGPAEIDLGLRPAPRFLGNFQLLRAELDGPGTRHFVASGTEDSSSRLRRLLGPNRDYILADISAGFVDHRAGYALITEHEIYGTSARRRVRTRFKGLPVDNLITLRPGDNVVHVDYGIGMFEGTRRMRHGDAEQDYLVIRYAGNDRVFVPVENLGLVDRYTGADEGPVRLDNLGGRSWLAARAKAARASAEYAGELLEIEARRSIARGTAFPPDGQWQLELETGFPHDETPDQLTTLAAVKHDMESSRPMDRLVCGDVGYGKTEIALRAALKAVAGVKQVALLVPTTILCYQHFANFRQRLAPFPVRIEMLSRFVAPGRQRAIIDDLAAGRVDIVVGTHLLLGDRVRFRDLGLLILDEEQKFGVRQKEKIKQLRAAVDLLTLTATPVPRTLYMTLAGLRDISTIHTPPPGRREVLTEVVAGSDRLIVDYVERELRRGGQVFFVHNRIQTLPPLVHRLERLLPGVDIAVAHGQMAARRLEQIYVDFAAGRHQVLLSTAIIESGLDMPNVNTLIVDRADLFGLADLHQLRGRVGRSGRQAYALFLIPARRELTPEARKRLSALLAYSQLGSGFRLALRDLEIRGAGDLLGLRQHGHIARVGLQLYARMIREAAARLRGETVNPEPELSLDVDAFLPESYVPDSFERVALYRRLVGLEGEDELKAFREELVDRFGRYPPVVENLFQISLVRIRARNRGLLKVSLRGSRATLVGPERTDSFAADIGELLAWLDRA